MGLRKILPVHNAYILLKLRLFLLACLKGKATLRKLWNVFLCSLFYLLKTRRSAPSPFILSLELGNECNANCLFCRDAQGAIHDINCFDPQPGGIAKGRMPYEMAVDIIGQIRKDVLIVVLYTNGEPLLYRDLPKLIRFCTDNHVMSMIATNGQLLNEKNIQDLLQASIDFIKVQLSGFTQDTYQVQVRRGDVEQIKRNIRALVAARNAFRCGTLIMVDYILYSYNRHQLPLIREFCRELGVPLNVRSGNPKGGLEGKEPAQSAETLPLKISCDWLWKGMQVNFNGQVLQCCDGVIFSGIKPYDVFATGRSDVRRIWNGEAARNMRRVLATKGRGHVPLCALCYRTGVAFKW